MTGDELLKRTSTAGSTLLVSTSVCAMLCEESLLL